MYITLKENETMQDLVDRLSGSFELVYDVAPVAYWYENLYENGRVKDIHFSKRMRDILGYKSIEEFPDELNTLMTFTHPDDVHIMLDDAIAAGTGQIDKYDVQYRIRKADGSYLWCNATGELIKDSNGTTVGMYGAFIDISEEMKLKRDQESRQQIRELMESFAINYEAAFLGNLNDGSYTVISLNDEIAEFFTGNESMPEAFQNYFAHMASPLDIDRLEREHVNFEEIKERFAVGESHALEYRRKTGEEYYWYRIAFNRVNEDEILIGLVNCDQEHTDKLIIEKKMSEYDALYVVALDSNRIRAVRSSRVSAVGEFDGGRNYTEMVSKFAQTVAPKYKEDWIKFSDPSYMKQYMANEDHREYVYELPGTERTMRRFSIDVIERVNGDAKSLLFSFVGIDDASAQTLKLKEQMLESSRIISALSEDYGCVNYVELSDDSDSDVTIGFRTSELLKRLIPGWENENIFSKKIDLLLKHVVYEEDKEILYAQTRRERVLENLKDKNTFFVNARMVVDGEIRYYQLMFSAIREDEKIVGVVVGLHSIDEQVRKAEEAEHLRNVGIQLRHEMLRSEVLNYMVDNDDDPIELLKNFAERIRVLIDCDQVIYRDLEETRIMVNSPAIENTWAVPIEFCQQCEHFDAHHPMYAGGYTEMDNCQEGWQGIPVYHECPIKSSLTRIIYSDGEVAGYLAIHYVQNYHHFTDVERTTLEEFARILSMSLSRYTAKIRAGELDSVKKSLNLMFSLSDQYDPIIVINPETGEYDWLMSLASDVEANTSMSKHGEDIYAALGVEAATNIYEEDREQFRAFYNRENLMKIAETGKTQEIENRWYVHTEGRYRWKYNKAVRMTDENGKDYVVVGVIDTTEAKEKEEEYRTQQKLIEEQQTLSDGLAREYHTIWLLEGKGEHMLHLYRSTGRKTIRDAVQLGLDVPCYDVAIVKYVQDYVHEEDQERVLEAVKFETIERETPEVGTYVVSYRRYNPEHTEYDYHQMVYARAEAADGTINYIFAYRDADKMLREQAAQQQQLAAALSMAESANRAKTTFLNNMSHDIRTPMNAIIGYTGLAASHIDSKERVQDYLSKISQSSDHLLSLINDVLDMSRIESGKMNLDEKEENLSDIIHTLRDIVQADIHSKQLDFFVDAVDVNDEDVICDKLRLNQVLLNILSNSIKYTAAGGTVSLRVMEKTVKANGYATYEFCIKDNGMGMDAEFLKTIFDPFTRVRSSTVSGIQGTGLGMAISKNIVDMMGGQIYIESEPGKGTEVRLIFDFLLQSTPKKPVEIPEFKGVRALVADDDSNTCISICNMVGDVGMRFEWCTSGKEAVIRAEAAYTHGDSFKVFIIDWIMPDMNGIETTRRIRKVIGDDVPIIILTAYDWTDIEEEAKDAGVTAFVSKPMFPSDLHRVLCTCIGKEDGEPDENKRSFEFAGKKILLVEDNELNREIATDILEEDGFIIEAAEDGNIAVDKMKQAKAGDYDLVLMDVQMPTMNGYEATRQIRALGTEISKIPILAMTANAFEEDRKLAIEAGMDEHIVKPIKIDQLKETLAKFL